MSSKQCLLEVIACIIITAFEILRIYVTHSLCYIIGCYFWYDLAWRDSLSNTRKPRLLAMQLHKPTPSVNSCWYNVKIMPLLPYLFNIVFIVNCNWSVWFSYDFHSPPVCELCREAMVKWLKTRIWYLAESICCGISIILTTGSYLTGD